GVFAQHFIMRRAVGDLADDHRYRDPHSTNCRTAAENLGLERDAIEHACPPGPFVLQAVHVSIYCSCLPACPRVRGRPDAGGRRNPERRPIKTPVMSGMASPPERSTRLN